MCGRFARHQALDRWAEALGVAADADVRVELHRRDGGPRYNIAPGTRAWIALCAADGDGELAFDEYLWKFPTPRGNRINVRSETAHRVPEYRTPFDRHRCVVLADGFYEPKGPKTQKYRPWFYFTPADGAPLFLGAIAGPDGFSILTRAPVAPVADVHDRSPVFVAADDVVAWLDPDLRGVDALAQYAPREIGATLRGWRVGDAARSAANEGPELITPLTEKS